jgi:hypothetical protein
MEDEKSGEGKVKENSEQVGKETENNHSEKVESVNPPEIEKLNGEKESKDMDQVGKEKKDSENKSSEKWDQEKQLRYILLGCGLLIACFVIGYFMIGKVGSFEYENIDFDTIIEGSVKFFHTSFVIKDDRQTIDYNVYIRNDPRELEKIPFEGEMNLKEMMVLENEGNFVCDGDGGIASFNLKQVFNAVGIQIIKDPEAKCDEQGRYMFVKIEQGEETKVEQTSETCYTIHVKDCEILKGMERFLLEAIVKLNN